MPTTLKLLLKPFLDLLRCIFEVGNFILDHLDIHILSYQKSVLFHIYLHVTVLDVCRYLQVRRYPVFGYSCSYLLFLLCLCLFLFIIFLFCCHLKLWNNTYQNYSKVCSIVFIWFEILIISLSSLITSQLYHHFSVFVTFLLIKCLLFLQLWLWSLSLVIISLGFSLVKLVYSGFLLRHTYSLLMRDSLNCSL
jgi:hypothetical protein